jgi:argininosuccinate lyase
MDPTAMADPKPPHEALSPGSWSGRFGEPVSPLVKRYTASVDFDRRLAAADIAGSLAHARMLTAAGVLTPVDLTAI